MSITVTRFPVMRCLLATVAVVLGIAAFSSAAQAACNYPDAEQVFSKWGDSRYYEELAPDGGFEEGGTGWTFLGGAHLVAGNESEYLNGDDDTSLSLPYRGVAVSPRVCVDQNTPVFRPMALNGGNEDAKLRVIVTYELPYFKIRSTDIRASDAWEPTDPLQFDTDGDRERVARISFTPKDAGGQWLVDDLYIDPFARR